MKNLAKYKRAAIASLASGDSMIDALKKLRSLPESFPNWSVRSLEKNGFVLGTGECIKGANGVVSSYYLIFDERGRLKFSIWEKLY